MTQTGEVGTANELLVGNPEGKPQVESTKYSWKNNIEMKNVVIWDVVPWRFNISRRFGRACRMHLQGRSNNASDEKC
jgi:hypothetical protein